MLSFPFYCVVLPFYDGPLLGFAAVQQDLQGELFPMLWKVSLEPDLREMVVMLGKSSKQYGNCAYLTSTKLAVGVKLELCSALVAFRRVCCRNNMPTG